MLRIIRCEVTKGGYLFVEASGALTRLLFLPWGDKSFPHSYIIHYPGCERAVRLRLPKWFARFARR